MGSLFSMISAFFNFFGLKKLFKFNFDKSKDVPDEDKEIVKDENKARKEFEKALSALPKEQREYLLALFDGTISSEQKIGISKAESSILYGILYINYHILRLTITNFNFNDKNFKDFKGKENINKLLQKVTKENKNVVEALVNYAAKLSDKLVKYAKLKNELIKKNLEGVKKISNSLKVKSKEKGEAIIKLNDYEVKVSVAEEKLAEIIINLLKEIINPTNQDIRSKVYLIAKAIATYLLLILNHARSEIDYAYSEKELINGLSQDPTLISLVNKEEFAKLAKPLKKTLSKEYRMKNYNDYKDLYKTAYELVSRLDELKADEGIREVADKSYNEGIKKLMLDFREPVKVDVSGNPWSTQEEKVEVLLPSE